RLEASRGVVDVGHPAAHAGGEVAAGIAQHHDHAAGHVFAAVVAEALHHRHGAGVADREALAGYALEIGFARDGAIEHRVADDDVAGGLAPRLGRLTNDDPAAGEALADVVVGVADQLK